MSNPEGLSPPTDILESVLSSIYDAVVAVDLKGQLIYTSQGAQRILKLDDLTTDVMNEAIRRLAFAAFRGEAAEECALVAEPKSEPRHYFLTARPLRDQNGSITGAVQVIREVTKQVASDFQEKTNDLDIGLFRQMFDMMPQLGWTAHADGSIDWYNRRWYEYTGKTIEELRGWGWQSVHDPKMLPLVLDRWNASIASGTPFEMKFPLRGKDDKFRWFLTRISPMRDETGRLIRWVGVNTDIQDEIDRQNQLKLLSEALPSAVWTTSSDGYCNYLSSLWKELTGFEPSECLGTKWLELLHPDDQERVWSTWQTCVQTGAKFDTEYRLRGKDGTYKWFLALGVPINNEAGERSQWLGSLTDINDKKARNQEMELMVNERTAQLRLARDEAIEAKATTEQALEAKSRFISTISHEVRTPMTGIIGLAEVLSMQDLGHENNTCMQAIFTSSKRLLQLLNNVLDVAKLESGKVKLERRKFPVHAVLGDVRQLIRPEAARKDIEIRGECDSNISEFVVGDEFRLRQILLNLAFNAVKFTAAGHVCVSANLKSQAENKALIRFSVSDTGPGLTPEQAGRLFQRFEQIDASIARTSGGSGLGLAICKDLVVLMGGDIGVLSEPGKGSTFWFEIPFALSEVDEP
ncbi:MAG TPA: PAS domain-containing protein [Drouetiella sp.]|jgi:PAS domain S-box-containing protein